MGQGSGREKVLVGCSIVSSWFSEETIRQSYLDKQSLFVLGMQRERKLLFYNFTKKVWIVVVISLGRIKIESSLRWILFFCFPIDQWSFGTKFSLDTYSWIDKVKFIHYHYPKGGLNFDPFYLKANQPLPTLGRAFNSLSKIEVLPENLKWKKEKMITFVFRLFVWFSGWFPCSSYFSAFSAPNITLDKKAPRHFSGILPIRRNSASSSNKNISEEDLLIYVLVSPSCKTSSSSVGWSPDYPVDWIWGGASSSLSHAKISFLSWTTFDSDRLISALFSRHFFFIVVILWHGLQLLMYLHPGRRFLLVQYEGENRREPRTRTRMILFCKMWNGKIDIRCV